MKPQLRIEVQEASQVGEARRAGHQLAHDAGFDQTATGRLALAVTELGTNLVRHARDGALLLGLTPAGAISLLSVDSGPGMDIQRCLVDGYSSAGSAGQGLGAVRRAVDRFSAFSQREGTVIATELAMHPVVRPSAGFDIAGLGVAAPGERVCGDSWGSRRIGELTMLLVADGLGHGPDAATAADAAVAVLESCRSTSPAEVLEQAHQAMRQTRGAAALLLSWPPDGTRVVFSGAGNVLARFVSGLEDRSLMSQHGTLGVQIRRLQDVSCEWPEHAVLVVHSDGIVSRWSLAGALGLLQCDPAVIAGWILRDHFRGRDDATVVVVKRNH